MDSSPTNKRGVVQWVVPKKAATRNREDPGRSGRVERPGENPSYSLDSNDYTASFHNDTTVTDYSNDQYRNNNQISHSMNENLPPKPRQESSCPIDIGTCRTICVIIEQYIKELKEHQELINNARSKTVTEVPYYLKDEKILAKSDLCKLKVRSEQTKSTETIKQLTSYLRELSTIKNQMDLEDSLVNEEAYNRLSDIRNSIIQALNDFVLANNDIDYPIICLSDPNEYDFCVDALRLPSSSQVNNALSRDHELSRVSLSDQTNIQQGNVLEMGQNNPSQIDLDLKQGQEIQKLEKDTVELRRLFSDFYDLVKEQGEQVDTIENNIVKAAQQISEGRNFLAHRPTRGLTVLVPVTGCVTGALIGGPIGLIIGGKLGGLTLVCASSLLGLVSSIGIQKCILGHESGSSGRIKVD